MWERIATFLQEFWSELGPFTVVDAFEQALVLRFGRFHRVLEPGLHWKWPGVERTLRHWVCAHTNSLQPQSLTTADGRAVVVSLVLTWRVSDIRKFLLEVESGTAAVTDAAYGALSKHVTRTPYEGLIGSDEAIRAEVRKLAFRWGVEVLRVQFRDLATCKSLRLWQSQVYE